MYIKFQNHKNYLSLNILLVSTGHDFNFPPQATYSSNSLRNPLKHSSENNYCHHSHRPENRLQNGFKFIKKKKKEREKEREMLTFQRSISLSGKAHKEEQPTYFTDGN